ncbi:nicotinate (nicotinamide) nucleotide adenylyltransferase [Microgenomates group bacterium]|nr:nicotinate (nicotinamide) nucleotide adenylyltransferase [Microgenomates group bacterium]
MMVSNPWPDNEKWTIIYGASFNPVHLGHLNLMKELAEQDWVKKLVLMPVGQHAFQKKLISGEDRLKMLALATKNIPKVVVSDWEIMKKTVSYTYETLLAYQIAHPEEKIAFILGSENLRDLEKWYRYEDLVTDFRTLIIERPQSEEQKLTEKYLEHYPLMRKWTLVADQDKQVSYGLVSSTKIRERVRKGESLVGWTTKEVANYIGRKKLYR